jgi:hypothetical protein
MSSLRVLGIAMELLAVVTAVFLNRTLKVGPYLHASPYVLVLIGAALLIVPPDTKSHIPVTLLFACCTAVVHAFVYLTFGKTVVLVARE